MHKIFEDEIDKNFLQKAIFVIIASVVIFACAVYAQGQSPTSPVPRPSTSSTSTTPSERGAGTSGVRGRGTRFKLDDLQYGEQGLGRTTGERQAPGAREKESAGVSQKEEKREKEEAEKKTTTTQPSGTKTITRGGGGKSESTKTAPGTTPTQPQGAQAPTPPGPRAPGMITGGAPPSAGTGRGVSGLLSSVSPGPSGLSGFFDILFSRKPEYGEVPDVGESLTLPGPMTVAEFLEAIHLATNWNILVSEGAQKVQMNFWLIEKKPKEALEVLKFHGLFYEYDKATNFLKVYTKEEWLLKNFGDLKPREFKVKYADISYVEAILSSLLSGIGKMISDTRTGTIYVWDIEDNLAQMEKTLKELDIPLEKKVFQVKHAEVSDIESVLSSMLTPNGSLLVDARTSQIFVWDSPVTLAKMEEVVKHLDIPLETRVFQSQYVNVDQLSEALQSLISQRGVVQLDPRTNTLIVTDLPSRLDRIAEFIQTLDIKLETRTWVINYADIDFIADQIENIVPSDMGQVIVNDAVHQITVTALPSRLEEIDKLIKTWDVKRKQVLIEAFIVEMDTEVERSLGINWSYYGTSGNVPIVIHGGSGVKDISSPTGSGETMSIGQLPTPIPRFGELTLDNSGNLVRPQLQTIQGKPVIDRFIGNNLAVALNYLDKQNKATILASPRVVVQDGEEAVFENATRVPYISGTAGYPPTYYYRQNQTSSGTGTGTDTTTGGTTNYPYYYPYYYGGYYGGYNRVEFIDVGTILSVVPRISEDNTILLDISAEDSSYKDKEIKAYDQTSTVPEKTIRHAETQLRVKSGETIVLGGLRKGRSSHLVTKTPILGDIPLLGKIFRNPSRTAQSSNLLIFITINIVDENTHPEAEMLTRAEDKIAEDLRHQSKSLWGKIHDQAYPDRKSEIRLSVGSTGTIFVRGQKVSIDELPRVLEEEKKKGKKSVLLRKAYRSPNETVENVKSIVSQVGLDIKYDDTSEPIVALPKDSQTQPAETSLINPVEATDK
ncbi:MAG: hypothetical protein N3G21_13005 [Candidatus Hydrogenedentes bacterium]|nr:hypothetical protein [Candidatus Hydrogenedentota bacterium]